MGKKALVSVAFVAVVSLGLGLLFAAETADAQERSKPQIRVQKKQPAQKSTSRVVVPKKVLKKSIGKKTPVAATPKEPLKTKGALSDAGPLPPGTAGVSPTGPSAALQQLSNTTKMSIIDDIDLNQAETATNSGQVVRVNGRVADSTVVSNPKIGEVSVYGRAETIPVDEDERRRLVESGHINPEAPARRTKVFWEGAKRGSKSVTFPTELESSFVVDAEKLDPGATVNAKGDVIGAMTAIHSLIEEEKEEEEEAFTKEEEEEGEDDGSLGADGASTTSASRPSSGNDYAKNFELPDVEAAADPAEDVPNYGTETCDEVDVDLTTGTVYMMERPTKDGAPDGECTRSVTSYPVQKGYSSCDDLLPGTIAAGEKVYAQYRRYYTGPAGTLYLDDDCQPDLDMAFDIVEERTNCPITTDTNTMKATVNAELAYENRSNNRVQLRSCSASSEVAAIDMEWTYDGCGIVHDTLVSNKSYKQRKAQYEYNGEIKSATSCENEAPGYDHVEAAWDCDVLWNATEKTAHNQTRKGVTIDDNTTYVTSCAPNLSSPLTVAKTDDTCSGEYDTDLVSEITYGTTRWYYLDNDDNRQYVSSCAADTDYTFPHFYVVEDYQINAEADTLKAAYPLEATYFTDTRTDTQILLVGASVRESAVRVNYTDNGTTTAAAGDPTYEGCNKFQEMNNVQQWVRPDNTELNLVTGSAGTEGPTDVCLSTVIATMPMKTGVGKSRLSEGCCSGEYPIYQVMVWDWYQNIEQTETKNIESGDVVATSCDFPIDSNYQGWQVGNRLVKTGDNPRPTYNYNTWEEAIVYGMGLNVHQAGNRQTVTFDECPF